eukprot:3021275-Amphidinium_carterae.1
MPHWSRWGSSCRQAVTGSTSWQVSQLLIVEHWRRLDNENERVICVPIEEPQLRMSGLRLRGSTSAAVTGNQRFSVVTSC